MTQDGSTPQAKAFHRINYKIISIIFILLMGGGFAQSAFAQNLGKGTVTNLPLPRFVSLKSKPVNLRVGPGKEYPVAWKFVKSGLPLEVIQEFEHWRRVRDSEGAEGWIFHSLLSSERKAVIAPWDVKKADKLVPAFKDKDTNAARAANIEAGAVVKVNSCKDNWCNIDAQSSDLSINAYVQQDFLWGVYPNETVE
jgi:SH3-like domain-containing protein